MYWINFVPQNGIQVIWIGQIYLIRVIYIKLFTDEK